MQIVWYEVGSFPPPVGYSVLSVKSALFEGGRHAVVYYGDGWSGEVIHNPNPKDERGTEIPNKDWLAFSVFAVIDPTNIKTKENVFEEYINMFAPPEYSGDWVAAFMNCNYCGKEHMSVHPVNCPAVECPHCNEMIPRGTP